MEEIYGHANRQYEVRTIQTQSELKQLWDIDADAYNATNLIEYVHLKAWWLAYPKGLYAIFVDGAIVGALGLWPVSAQWINAFACGDASEKGLLVEPSRVLGERGPDDWYLSGLVIEKQSRNRLVVPVLLEEAMLDWAMGCQPNQPVCLSAIAASRVGQKLLDRYGFTLVTPGHAMRDGYPLYMKRIANKDLDSLVEEVG